MSPNRMFYEAAPQVAASTPAQTSVGTGAVTVLAANPKRKGVLVQNTGVTTIYLTFGTTMPTDTAYHVALGGGTIGDDGKGGIWLDDAWAGQVNAKSSAAGGTIVVTEFRLGSPDWNLAADWGLS